MLLALDTATRTLSLALHDGKRVCAEMSWNTLNQHTVELVPAVRDLMARASVSTADLTVLGVSQGPGSFNGLRIGFSMAKGLALARNLPLVSVPTLDIVAAAQPFFDGILVAVLQVGRGRICRGSYRWSASGWQGQDDLEILSWQGLLDNIHHETISSGEIDAQGYSELEQAMKIGTPIHLASPALALRRAGFLAQIAWERWTAGVPADAGSAAPLYLHQPGVAHP